MKQIKNTYPCAEQPIIEVGKPWSFEISEWNDKNKIKILLGDIEEDKEFFITAKDFEFELKGIEKESGEEIDVPLDYLIRDGKEYEFFTKSGVSAIVLKLKINKEFELKIDNESQDKEGIYHFDFLDNKKITLKFLTGAAYTAYSTGNVSSGSKDNLYILNTIINKESFVYNSDTEFSDLISTLSINYHFSIYEIGGPEIFPTYKNTGYVLEDGKNYKVHIYSDEIVQSYDTSNPKYCQLQSSIQNDKTQPFTYITGEVCEIKEDASIVFFDNLEERLDEAIINDEIEETSFNVELLKDYTNNTYYYNFPGIFQQLFFSFYKIDLGVKRIVRTVESTDFSIQRNKDNNFYKIQYYIPEGIGNSGEYTIQINQENKTGIVGLTEPYLLINKPEISLDTSESDSSFEVSCEYSETNLFPKLWHEIKIKSVLGNEEKIVYDSGRVYTSNPIFSIEYNTLLPNENYKVELQVSDIKGNLSAIYSESFETSPKEQDLDFFTKDIKNCLSESFVFLNLEQILQGNKNIIYPDNHLFPSTSLFPLKSELNFIKNFTGTMKILREDVVNHNSIWIQQDFDFKNEDNVKLKIYDYSAKANVPYIYWGYTNFSPPPQDGEIVLQDISLNGIRLNEEPIVAEWDRWTLMTANKTKDEKIYHIDKVFTFEMNLSSGSMTNNTAINMSKNFTEYPIIQKDKSNFYAGSLTALMGVRKWGSTAEDFEQTLQMLEELKSLSTNYQPKFLKDRSGHLWRVEINGAITVDNTDNLAAIDLKTMTVPWVQIGEADDISLIYIGDEKKEELYC